MKKINKKYKDKFSSKQNFYIKLYINKNQNIYM